MGSSKDKVICMIPARGGSKRITRKNLKNFIDKPIIAYSILLAIESKLFEEVHVYTEDEEIKKVSKSYGALTYINRSLESANDYATLSDTVIEFQENYYNVNGTKPSYLCCLLATSPLLDISLLQRSFNILRNDSEIDSIRPVVEYNYPIQRALRLNRNSFVEFFNPEYQKTRSQDLEKSYHDAGQFYFMKWDKGLVGTKKKGILIQSMQAQDIDTLEDWEIAEFKYKYKNLNI